MQISLGVTDLLDYTEWQRDKWQTALRRQPGALAVAVGANGDGRFKTVGDVIRHIFSAEKRYVERLTGRALTDAAGIAADDVDALFRFGQQSRSELRELIEVFPSDQWDVPREFKLMNLLLQATPKKIIAHVVLHEIRHWAQIATMLRLDGVKVELHDFLLSPVLDGAPALG